MDSQERTEVRAELEELRRRQDILPAARGTKERRCYAHGGYGYICTSPYPCHSHSAFGCGYALPKILNCDAESISADMRPRASNRRCCTASEGVKCPSE